MKAPRYVESILGGRIEVSGFLGTSYAYASEAELVARVLELIADGVAFVHEPAGWPPAAVLEDLQQRGLLLVPFTAITWVGPGEFKTFQVPAAIGNAPL